MTYLTVTVMRQRPDDQRQQPEHLAGRSQPAADACKRLAEGVERAGADIAIDDAERAEHEEREVCFLAWPAWSVAASPACAGR